LQNTVGIIIIATGTPVVIITAYLLATVSKNDIDKSALTAVLTGGALYCLLSILLIRAGQKLIEKRHFQ
jgi:hypothetical protein